MARNVIILPLLILVVASDLVAQDIPLFSQKLTNSFIYNPAIAGHTFGSVTYSYQQSFNHIPNAPKSNFLSFHAPIQKNKFGVGLNMYLEEVNFLRNTHLSTAFAHHLRFQHSMLSMGVSGEYNSIRLSGTTNSNPLDPEYQNLANGPVHDFDFSTGAVYQTADFKVGISANRLATAWLKKEHSRVLSSYYTVFFQGIIPIRGGADVLEPYVTYRKFSETNNMLDIGLYYTYDKRFTGGVAWRSTQALSMTLAARVIPQLLVGYTHELFLGQIRNQVGGSSQFTLRYDFREYGDQDKLSLKKRNSFKKLFNKPARRSVTQARHRVNRPRTFKKQ